MNNRWTDALRRKNSRSGAWYESFSKTLANVPRSSLRPICVPEGDTVPPQFGGRQEEDFKIRLANNDGRRDAAGFLLRRRYAWRGYDIENFDGLHPNRISLSAYDHDETIATISVGLDSASGLFVDKLYRAEVDLVRAQNRTVCEFTQLAVDGHVKSMPVLAGLFHIAYIYVRRLNSCTDLFVEVNPRHVLFYKRMLGFRESGSERFDPRVGASAVLLRLDLRFAEAQIAEMGGHAELAREKRSLYPYFFSPHEETGVAHRLSALDGEHDSRRMRAG
jgi:hypothetical protein